MGAWGLLRELPLLEPRVLAVASLDLRQVLIAAATGQQEVDLQGSNVKLHNNAAIFITLTTTDERGHTDRHLPACLRPRFRPVAMRRPEPNLVVEIILLSEGIRDSNDFSLKICRLFELCSLHLSSQHHYDFSIRKMVHVARKTGEYKHLSIKADDEQLILQAIMLHVAPQLLPDDRRIFLEFTSDLFPGVEVPVADHRDLSIAIQNALESSGLMPLTWSVNKCLQIFEALLARNCVILAGKSGSGKSTAWQMLSKAINTLNIPECNQVQVHPIYPNSLTYSELYGDYDGNKCQYHNGLLTDKIRELCSDNSGKAHWIVLDGEIANYWTDMFMGILDNCQIMTTGNGEQINITEKMKVVIEAETLENAPPSLLSLSSCVYFDHRQLGYQPFIDAWLQKLKNVEMKNELSDLMAVNIDRCLEFKEKNCNELIPRSNLNAVQTLCQLIECFLLKTDNSHLVWSIFGAMQSEDRVKVDVFVRDLEVGVFPPDDLVFDYCVDYQWNGFVKWTDKFPLKFTYDRSIPIYKMNIPTLDLARYSFITSALVTGGHSILLTGHIGSGKSLIANYVLKNLDKDKYSTININGTSERTRCSLIQRLERKLEKRFGRALVPARGKTLVALIEDIGVTPLGEDGTQPTFEALRYWREHGNWIDVVRNVARVQGVQIVATLRHGGARLSPRLSRHFSLLDIGTPSETELYNLFTLPLSQHLLGFGEQIKLLCKVLLTSSIDMYKSVRLKLLATPINSHYAFSLKNLTEVIQGLLLSSKDHHNTKSAMCKLWIHENLRVYYDRISNLTDRLWFIRELSRQVTNHYGLSTTVLCPGKRYPLFVHVRTDFFDEGGGAYIETSAEDEQERLEAILKGTHAVMFREAAEHVARAVRVLTRPSSHLLLLGQAGCGRHSLLKLACRVCNVQLVYAEVSSDPASQVETFREQMRTLVRRSAVLGQHTALLLSDSQVTQDSFLDIVNNIIQPGHIYDLFGDDVIEEIATEYIEGKVQEKLHIILCFDFDDPKFRERLKQFPSLASCTMDYFSEWSKDALLQVAKKYLARLEIGDEEMQNGIRETVANLFAQFHDSVLEIVTYLKLKLTITPAHYVDCLKTYTLLLQKKQSELKEKTKKLKQGLKKIEETRQSVEIMADELLHAQRRERQRQCEAALVTLGQRRREVEEQSRALDSSAKQLVLEETAVQQLARLAHAAMDEAVPSLEDADMALDSLNHKELMEMRAYGRPPEAVELAMSAVLILKQTEPTWVEAKRQLADANFIDQLHNFDKDHIPDKTLKSITSFTLNPEFNPEKIGTVSAPAKYLAQWVLAIEKYARIYRVAAPKRAKLERASRDLREHQAELSDLKSRLAQLKSQLEDQKLAYENSLQIRETLNAQAEEMGARLQRANQLVSGLGTEEDIWRSHVEQYSSLKKLLIGDCFIVSALLNYAGPFSAINRQQLQEKLTQLVNEANVNYSSDISLVNYLSNKATLMKWQMKGLPRDSFSVDSATIALQNSFIPSDSPSPVCRWSLLIDPQGLALNWLRSLQEFQELRITDQRKEDFASTVGECIEKGMPLVIDKVEDTLNPILMPLLIKNLSKYGNEQPSIKFHEKDIPYNSGFKLYFRTLIHNPKYGPEISSRINVIDFTVQQKGLEETLLDVLITEDKPSLEKERKDLCADILTGYETLENLEKSILRILTEISEALLDHGTVMESLENNKTATLSACKSLSAHHEAYAILEIQRENYLPCATRATVLYSIQTHLQNLNPMYHFSLKSYIEEFENSVKCSTHNQNLTERLTAINELHTVNFYKTTNQALFVRDRLPFAFLLCIRLLEISDQNIISLDLLNFLAQTLTIKLCDASETLNPSFVRLPDYVWDNVTKLERSSTKYHGLKESLIEFTKEWYTWFSSSQESPLIGKFGSLDVLSQLVISTCLRPDRLAINVRRFITKHSRQQLNEAVSSELVSSFKNRLVLLLPGRDVDLTSGLEQLAQITSTVQLVTPGQGQQKHIETVLHEAAKTGECVILIDCHLSLKWLHKFENIFETWSHSIVHNTFRCWISSETYHKFPIEIAQQAKKISVDKPEDLRLTIKRLSSDTSKDIKLNQNLILQIATLHAIFLHRLQFVSLGWNCNYDFSDNDFMVILETNEENAITTGNHQQSTIDLPTSVNPENYGLNRLASASVLYTCRLILEILPEETNVKKFKRSLVIQRPMELMLLTEMNVAHMTDLDDMNWIFTIDSSSTLNADEIPSTLKDGCILSGLRLEGAAWNKEKACLSEAKTSCIMPNIIIKPTRKSAHSKPQDTYICPCFANDARSQYLFSVPLNPVPIEGCEEDLSGVFYDGAACDVDVELTMFCVVDSHLLTRECKSAVAAVIDKH
ncbi:hypothetical protein B566_EDAN013871 [Ephemera danica]|nr:hypothetical protein B566_EDAN013871 [Ephemera danica]